MDSAASAETLPLCGGSAGVMVIAVAPRAQSPLVVVAGGGTGGHLYPALAVAEALQNRIDDVRFLFFGSQRKIDAQILASGRWDFVPQTILEGRRSLRTWTRIMRDLSQSARDCRTRFALDRPDIVLGTGGITSLPVMCEAMRARIPTAMLNPDAIPGRANRGLSGGTDKIFIQWATSVVHFPDCERVVVSGCPVRPSCWTATRSSGVDCFGLNPDKRTLLVTGASQGSRSVNRAVMAILNLLARRGDWQVLHLTGHDDYDTVREAYAQHNLQAVILRYTENMGAAYAVADLVISRAGASTLAELTAVGVPSILLPYPFHRDEHQFANARQLIDADGDSAAIIIRDAVDPAVNGPRLGEVLNSLLDDRNALRRMSAAALRMGRRDAADVVARHLCQMMHVQPRCNEIDSLEPFSNPSR